MSPAEDDHVQAPVVAARKPVLLACIAFVASGAVFVLVQDLLALRNVNVLRATVSHRLGGVPVGLLSIGRHLTETGLETSILYLGFAGAGVALAFLGRRILFAAPALTYVAYGLAMGPAHVPQPIGTQWASCASGCGAWYSTPWIGASLDLLLVLVPGVVVALIVRGSRWPGRRLDGPIVAGIGVALGATVVVYRTTVIVNGSAALPETLAVACFALLAGTAKRWWPWAHVVVAFVLSGSASVLLWNALYADSSVDLWGDLVKAAVPLVAVALVAASWQPFASALRKGPAHPIGLFAAANALNVADAGLTAFAIGAGKARELNPLVTWMGFPAKLLLVFGLTWFLYRRRASSLIWPVAALLVVLCYHLSGLIVDH